VVPCHYKDIIIHNNVLHVQKANFGTAPDIMMGIGCNFLCNCRSHLLHYGQYKLLSQMAPHNFVSVKPASWTRSISQVSLHVEYSS